MQAPQLKASHPAFIKVHDRGMAGTSSRRRSVGQAYSPVRALMVVLLPVSRLFGGLIRFNPHNLWNISLFHESPTWRKSMKLRRNQYCPIHRSLSCCGREPVSKGRALDWLPAALSVAVIVAESTATMSAVNTSGWLYPLWARLFGPMSTPHWAEVHHLIRKTGHFVGYGCVSLAFLYGWLRTLHRRRGKYRPIWRRAAFLAVSCTLLIAILDEYHQRSLPSRTSSPIDVCIDLCGAIAAQLLLLTWSRCWWRQDSLSDRFSTAT